MSPSTNSLHSQGNQITAEHIKHIFFEKLKLILYILYRTCTIITFTKMWDQNSFMPVLPIPSQCTNSYFIHWYVRTLTVLKLTWMRPSLLHVYCTYILHLTLTTMMFASGQKVFFLWLVDNELELCWNFFESKDHSCLFDQFTT